ncbi:hypothetical protein AB0F17_08435 [Nonomuraea sp. NPDC026600]|uniref:hypothetical protein n=1 Tax=Nonomuraea sp. NPDC026600 TaxID=3155363 RepID=UPI0033EC8C22
MRIQILPLPSVMVGDDMDEPFALVIDQWEGTPAESAAWAEFGLSCCALAVLTTPYTVEIVDRYADAAPAAGDADAERFADECARQLARKHGGWYPDRTASPQHVEGLSDEGQS